MSAPLFYIVMGAAGSGRREVLASLIDGGVPEDAQSFVLLPEAEAAHADDERLGATGRWTRDGDQLAMTFPDEATHVFWLADGRANPVDQIEALVNWVRQSGVELARVFCVVNCQLAEKHPPLLAWYDACIHFSDIVLLNRREGVENKWISDFQNRYRDQFLPCLFELVKAGRVKNAVMALQPEARRLSHVFDADEWAGISLEGVEFGYEDEDEDAAEPRKKKERGKDKEPEEDEDDGMPEIDPYFERMLGGRRAKEIPDISRFVG